MFNHFATNKGASIDFGEMSALYLRVESYTNPGGVWLKVAKGNAVYVWDVRVGKLETYGA